jgi:serine/threonine protein kinase
MPRREEGEVLGGKYRLVNRLGTGGMGSVWRAEHLTLSSPVALKLIEPTTARESDALHRFLREARTAAALRSPHVVQILDYGVDGDSPYIAMELLDGESLAERLARQSRLSPTETARIIQHIARALGRAHEAGIVHRDLKPENVFIVKNDDEEVAKVLDFGIVKADPNTFGPANSGAATRTGTLLGTPYFMSPEQAEGVKSVDFRADIWALGVIAYRCLIGQLPFCGDSVGRLILEICSRPLPVPSHRGPVPDGFDAWFARACAREANDRFESAKRAAAELSRLTDDAASSSPVETPRPPETNSFALATTTLKSSSTEVLPLPRRRPRPFALALAAVAAVSLASAISVRLLRSTDDPGAEDAELPPQSTVQQRLEALEASAHASASPALPPSLRPPPGERAPVTAAPGARATAGAEPSSVTAPGSTAPVATASASSSPGLDAPSERAPAPSSTGASAHDAMLEDREPSSAPPPPRARKAPERKAPEAAAKPKIDLGI